MLTAHCKESKTRTPNQVKKLTTNKKLKHPANENATHLIKKSKPHTAHKSKSHTPNQVKKLTANEREIICACAFAREGLRTSSKPNFPRFFLGVTFKIHRGQTSEHAREISF